MIPLFHDFNDQQALEGGIVYLVSGEDLDLFMYRDMSNAHVFDCGDGP